MPGLPDFDAVKGEANGTTENLSISAATLDGATADIKVEAEAEEENIPAVSTKEAETKDDANPQLDQDTDLFKSQVDEEFDYLAYSQDRAMFVWGDLVGMGLVKKEELPEELRKRLKVVEY